MNMREVTEAVAVKTVKIGEKLYQTGRKDGRLDVLIAIRGMTNEATVDTMKLWARQQILKMAQEAEAAKE